jgi:hypothetical protein
MPGSTQQSQRMGSQAEKRTSAKSAIRTLLAAFIILSVAFSFGLFSLPVFCVALTKAFHGNRAQAAGGGSRSVAFVLLLIAGRMRCLKSGDGIAYE